MAIDFVALKAELLSGHPDTGSYNVDDALARDQLNAVNRPANGGISDMLSYLCVNRNRTNEGVDTQVTAIYGRLVTIANAAIDTDPFGRGTVNKVTLEQKNAAQMFIGLLQNNQLNTLDFEDTEIDKAYTALNSATTHAGVFSNADVAALKALSQNKQSRANELGFGKIRIGEVTYARSI